MIDKEYPVYSVNVVWTMGKPTYWTNPDGKKIESKTNCTGFTLAFRRKFSEETIKNKVLKKWWPNYRKEKLEKDEPISDLKIEVKFLGMHSWWISWFTHETFNSFETDQDAFDSFFRWFTDNKFQLNYVVDGYGLDDFMTQTDRYGNKHCLMGAEDQWRWEVCHCKGCEKRKHRRTITGNPQTSRVKSANKIWQLLLVVDL